MRITVQYVCKSYTGSEKITWIQKILHGSTSTYRKSKINGRNCVGNIIIKICKSLSENIIHIHTEDLMNCIYRSCGANRVYLLSLRGYWSVFTVPAGLMKCIYRLPFLWKYYVYIRYKFFYYTGTEIYCNRKVFSCLLFIDRSHICVIWYLHIPNTCHV